MASLNVYRKCALRQICKCRKRNRYSACCQHLPSSRSASIASSVTKPDVTQHSNILDSADKSSPEKLVIPKRIHRSPTDILDALSGTIGRNPPGPKYMFMDDPMLIPKTGLDVKQFTLASISGKKAAQYVMKRWPKSFATNPLDPTVEIPDAFKVQEGASNHKEGSVEFLQDMIDLRKPEEAYTSYRLLKDEGENVPESLQLDLLDLLCVYNSTNLSQMPEELQVEGFLVEWKPKHIMNRWMNGGPADTLFKELPTHCARSYCSMIKGLSKYSSHQEAVDLYLEMSRKNLKPDGVPSYSAAMRSAVMSNTQLEKKIRIIETFMRKLNKQGLKPTDDFFCSIFQSIYYRYGTEHALCLRYCGSLLSEMYACGLEPSLRAWYLLMIIVYPYGPSQNDFLKKVVQRLQGKRLSAEHPDDLEFFGLAMTKAAKNVDDLHLAFAIDKLLNYQTNYHLIGVFRQENLYYRQFIGLLCKYEDMETIMEYYRKIIPYWVPSGHLFIIMLLEAMQQLEHYKYLPEIWADMFKYGFTTSSKFMTSLVYLAAKPIHKPMLQTQLYAKALQLYQEIQFKVMRLAERGETVFRNVNGRLMSDLWQICLNSKETDMAKEMYSFYQDYSGNMDNHEADARGEALENLAHIFIADKNFRSSVDILSNLAESEFQVMDRVANKMKSEMNLSPDQLQIVDAVIDG